jgi:hypothetical protein
MQSVGCFQTQDLDMKKAKEDLATGTKINEEAKKRPLLSKSGILKILAEAVRSYSGCAKLITDHSYYAGQSEMVTEVRHHLCLEMISVSVDILHDCCNLQ